MFVACSDGSDDGNGTTYYTVTFLSNGGSDVSPKEQAVASGKLATKPQDPTREGNTFLGWYKDGKTIFDFSTPITENTTLIAQWKAQSDGTDPIEQFSIKFDTAGIAGSDESTLKLSELIVDSGTSISQNDLPELTYIISGYEFAGWYFDGEYTKPFAQFTVTKSVTLYAKFTKNGQIVQTYKVTYVNDKATEECRSTTTANGLVTKTMYLTGDGISRGIEGYFFGGWFYDEQCTTQVKIGDLISEDKTFYAKWIAKSEIEAVVGTSQDFSGVAFSDITGALYTRSTAKNADLDDYEYTPAGEFATSTSSSNYYLGGDIYRFADGVVIWQESWQSSYFRVAANSNTTQRFEYYSLSTNDAIAVTDTQVNISNLRGFIAIKTPSNGKVAARFLGSNNSNISGDSKAVAALVNANGTILKAIAVNNSSDTSYVLSAEATPGEVIYFIWSRNGDEGGGLKVTEISDREAEESEIVTPDEYKVIYVNDKAGSSAKTSQTTTTGLVTNSLYYTGSGITHDVEGYFFCGWYYDEQYIKPVVPGDTLTSKETTFYAKWLSIAELRKMAETSVNFVGLAASDVDGAVYIRSASPNTVTNSYDYTPVTAFPSESAQINYYLGAGIYKFAGDGIAWLELFSRGMSLQVAANTTTSKQLVYPPSLSTKLTVSDTTVDLKTLRTFIAVNATAQGTVTARFRSSSNSSKAVAALVNEKGEILTSQSIDYNTQKDYSLSAEVSEPGLVFLVWSRNEDESGSPLMYDIVFKKPGALNLAAKTKTVTDAATAAALIKTLTKDTILEFSGAINNANLRDIVAAMKYNDSVKVALDLSHTTGITTLSAADDLFKDCTTLLGISLPSTVTTIEAHAFEGCTALAEVKLPDSLQEIPDYAFHKCTALKTINFPSKLHSIGSYAFGGYNDKENPSIQGCPLTSLDLSGTNVNAIGDYAFYKCYGLESISLPTSLTFIGDHAFHNNSHLKSLDLSELTNLYSIADQAFNYCYDLENVLLPSSLTSIGNYAFEKSGLRSIDLSETNVCSLGNYAFSNCSTLETVTLPSSVDSIGKYAFADCGKLISVVRKKRDTDEIKNLSIGVQAFANDSILTDFDLDGVTSIGTWAFRGCYALVQGLGTVLTIPDSVQSVAAAAFENIGFTEITVGSQTYLMANALQGCSSLEKLTFNNTMQVDSHALDSLGAKDELTIVYNYTGTVYTPYFAAARNVIFGDDVTEIPSYFAEISHFSTENQYLSYDEGSDEGYIKDTGGGSTSEKENYYLYSVTFGEKVEAIGQNAFKNCVNLTSITIPASVTRIESGAFYGSGLTSAKFDDTENWKKDEVTVDVDDAETAATLLKEKDDTYFVKSES
ncbi:MAG: leucine-rich repeat protein [Treponema sp.]|nr:leucine-rich repeat protein [Treponema sp.]